MSATRVALLVFLGVFAVGLALFTRRNDFPFYYHPDEPGKVGQLIKGKRNFHHPMLMMNTVDLTRRITLWGDARKDSQKVVLVGRWVTATVAALTAAALALLAVQVHGVLAGIAVGALCVINPLLFELAHYLKEDPYLALGVALTCVALQRMITRPDPRGLALLGAACAIAAGGKFVGFALLPFVIGAAITVRHSALSRAQRLRIVAGSFTVTWLALNWWIFKSPELLWQSLGEETIKAFGTDYGPRRAVPHTYYLTIQNTYSTALLWVGAALWLVLVASRRLRINAGEWLLLSTALLLFAVFSFTPKTSPRYHLPIALAISYFAAVGAVGCADLLARPRPMLRAALAGVFFLPMLFQEARQLVPFYTSFSRDDRVALEAFVRANVPANAVIAQDEATNLPEPERRPEHAGRAPLPQRMIKRAPGKKEIADHADLAGLRAAGVTHLAICARTYSRYFTGDETPERRFYTDALNRGKILFSRDPGAITYLQPGVTLIDITQFQ